MKECTLCPRRCRADRTKTYGLCGGGDKIRIAKYGLHFWEEPCISGTRGSGAIFFAGCPLHCIYCQNREISFLKGDKGKLSLPGKKTEIPELYDIFFLLKDKGAHNINLVTGDHFIPLIAEAMIKAKADGFGLPFIFNCSGYETVESLKMLDGLIDIYLADHKYEDKAIAKAFSHAEDYPEVVKAALSEMVRQQPDLEYDEDNMLKKGVIVRNLLLPKHVMNSKMVLKYLHEAYGENIIISILSQYTPGDNIPDEFPELKRRVSRSEYDRLTDYAIKLGIENAYIQDTSSSDRGYIPDFIW